MSHPTTLTDQGAVAHLTVDTTTREGTASVVLHGEADGSTLHDLDVALHRVELDAVTRVHVDLSELHFADTSTIRRLAGFTRAVKESGKDVTTVGAGSTLRTVFHLLAVDDDLNLA